MIVPSRRTPSRIASMISSSLQAPNTGFAVLRDIRGVSSELGSLDLKGTRQVHVGNECCVGVSRSVAITARHNTVHEVVAPGD